MLDAFDSAFARALAKKINVNTAKCAEELAFGRATTHEDYRNRVGYIRGLTDVLAWMRDVESELLKPEGR